MLNSKDLGNLLSFVPLGRRSSIPITACVSPFLEIESLSFQISPVIEDEPPLASDEVPPPPPVEAPLRLSPLPVDPPLADIQVNSQSSSAIMTTNSPHITQGIVAADPERLRVDLQPILGRNRFKTVAQRAGHDKRDRPEEGNGASKRFALARSPDSSPTSTGESLATPTHSFKKGIPMAPRPFDALVLGEDYLGWERTVNESDPEVEVPSASLFVQGVLEVLHSLLLSL